MCEGKQSGITRLLADAMKPFWGFVTWGQQSKQAQIYYQHVENDAHYSPCTGIHNTGAYSCRHSAQYRAELTQNAHVEADQTREILSRPSLQGQGTFLCVFSAVSESFPASVGTCTTCQQQRSPQRQRYKSGSRRGHRLEGRNQENSCARKTSISILMSAGRHGVQWWLYLVADVSCSVAVNKVLCRCNVASEGCSEFIVV